MNILIGTVLLVGVAAWLWRKLPDETTRAHAHREILDLAIFIFPRIVIALIGAALFADLLPEDVVRDIFGVDAGLWGLAIAVVLGPLTPGGPFVCFAIAAAGLQVGATEGTVMGYVTSWAAFSLTKVLAYELPILGANITAKRLVLSLPIPFLVGFATMALG